MSDELIMSHPITVIEIEFRDLELDATYQCISSLLDLSLTSSGVTLSQLERADVALCELVEALATSAPICSARLQIADDRTQLVITGSCDTGDIDLPDSARELIETGLESWSFDGHDTIIVLPRSELR